VTATTPLLDTTVVKSEFPVFDDRSLHFLDSAASSQKPASVIEAMSEFAGHGYANVNRGAYRLSVDATERYEAARARVARFIGAAGPEEIVFTRGTTTGLNLVAAGWGGTHLGEGDTIVLTEMEHHANIVPWQMVCRRTGASLRYLPLGADARLDMGVLERVVDETTKVISVTAMSNVLGTIPDLTPLAEAGRAVGAMLVVDGAQYVPHFPVDVSSGEADLLAFSAHKMLGPTGVGVLWGRPERLAEIEPVEGGGDMIADVTLEGSTWAPVPRRFEAGTPPIIEVVGLAAAIDYLEGLGMEAVAAHDRALTGYALERLAQLPAVAVQGPPTTEGRGGVVSFTMGDVHAHDLATILDQHDVAVRAGHHCAKPLMRVLGTAATARASFYVYNDTDDVDALVEALGEAARLFGVA
jgi:cysteine desulfurase / selenocysteine lyase